MRAGKHFGTSKASEVEVVVNPILVSFRGGSELSGMSPRFLQIAANDPDPARRLRTVRISRRRLIRYEDLQDWVNRVAREDVAADQ